MSSPWAARDFHQPRRSAAVAGEAMAATSHPFATLTAIDILRAGGNAVDAAIAAVAVLCVAEPAMTSVAGDCFVLYAPKAGKPIALNGSGQAPAKATLDWYVKNGIKEIGPRSPHAVTIPGAVDAWEKLHKDYGKLDWEKLLQPAIGLAENGLVVTPRVGYDMATAKGTIAHDPDAMRVFAPHGNVYGMGERLKQPALAATLRRIAREGRKGFYEGPVARDIVSKLNALGGLHTLDDFAACKSDYVEPITASYHGHDIYECPPNGQGLAALMILRTLEGYDLKGEKLSAADRIHLLAEASKAAYAARDQLFGDPRDMKVSVERMLSDDWTNFTRAHIRMDRASTPKLPDDVAHKDTVYFCIVDRDRNVISFIDSMFERFGTGIMAPESGLLLHNRGRSFRVIQGHPNAIGPGKRPMHTIIPGMALKDGKAVMPFGVMGGHFQAMGHGHLVSQIVDRGLDPQAAIEAPRAFPLEGVLQVEQGVSNDVVDDLAQRGHVITRPPDPLGGAQLIWIDHKSGTLTGGSESRKDGMALGY